MSDSTKGKSAENWEARDIWSLGPKFRIDVNNPQKGCNGSEVYTIYGVNNDKDVNLSGLTSSDIGFGKSNTEAIVNPYPDSATAAKFCNDVKINYYDDWFLPSINELNLIFEKRHSIGNFSSDYSSHYWASTSYDDETSSGAFSRFFNTASICFKSKDELFHIRPVRYF